MRSWIIAKPLLGLLWLAYFQLAAGEEDKNESSYFEVLPATALPAKLKAEAGKVSLVTDFKLQSDGWVNVYLVNLSKQELPLVLMDGDVFLKLEYLDQGRWVRAQTHEYAWCGNSYHTSYLRPGKMLLARGYQPSTGTKANVRYRLYQESLKVELVSPPGEGFVSATEVEAAVVDDMGLKTASFDLLVAIALGKTGSQIQDTNRLPLSYQAMCALASGKFQGDKVKAALTDIAEGKDPTLARYAHAVLGSLLRPEKR